MFKSYDKRVMIRFFLKKFELIFKILVIVFLFFSRGHSLMSLSIFYHSNRWLTKYEKQKCEEFYSIKEPFKFLRTFINIMVRIYLNKTIQILDKINAYHHKYIFIRQRVCWQVYELMSDFCSDTNVDFFNQLFDENAFYENYQK